MLTNPSAEQMQGAMKSVLEIFKKWSVVFGNKYKLENVDRDTLEVWAIALIDLRATNEEVALSLRLSLSQKWSPTTPADFIDLARNAVDEYPSAELAFKTACNNAGALGNHVNWLNPVVRETASRIGLYELARADSSEFKRFKEVYEHVKTEHRQGADFKIPESHRLEFDEAEAVSVEKANEYMSKIKQQLKQVKK